MHIKVLNMTTCFAMHMMTYPVLVFKTPEVLQGSYHVGVSDVRELVALPGEAPNVLAEGLTGLLMAVLEVPWVPRAFVRALEVFHKDLL